MQPHALEGGFVDAPIDAAQAFRNIMRAMAMPGQILTVSGARPPVPLSVAAGVLLLTLCDPDTPVFLGPSHDTSALRDWITFHTGAPLAAAEEAQFAIGGWSDLGGQPFSVGTPQYPDRSATLIVEVENLQANGAALRGPGIKGTAHLSLPEVGAFQRNAALFPLGRDHFFTHGAQLAALPRTTKVS